jgi:hypothetical protein
MKTIAMNTKITMLAIVSAVLATGLAMSVLATSSPVYAQVATTAAAASNGTAGSTSAATSDVAAAASTAGEGPTLCLLTQGCESFP